MRKLLFLSFFTLITLMPFSIKAADTVSVNDKFQQANQFFEKGDLEKALEIYHALVGQGFESTELYYNLGNLYFRKGERGKAVLWYERAARLSPRDSDVQFNLSLARSHIKDEGGNYFQKIFLYFTGNEIAWLLSLLIWIFFGFLGAKTVGWIKSETWPSLTLWFSGSLLLLATVWFGVFYFLSRQPLGVVINPPGEVRNGPGNDYAVGFTIPEGSKVIVLNKRPDWMQIGVPSQGLKGWIPNSDVELIVPNLSLLS